MYLIKWAFYNALKFLARQSVKTVSSLTDSIYISTDEENFVKGTDIFKEWRKLLVLRFIGVFE